MKNFTLVTRLKILVLVHCYEPFLRTQKELQWTRTISSRMILPNFYNGDPWEILYSIVNKHPTHLENRAVQLYIVNTKTVLLRDHKRCTTRGVTNTNWAVLDVVEGGVTVWTPPPPPPTYDALLYRGSHCIEPPPCSWNCHCMGSLVW